MAETTIDVISLNVADLPENDIWFASAAAWKSYWAQQSFSANIPIADVNDYGVVKEANTVAYSNVTPSATVTFDFTDTDAVVKTLASIESFEELKTFVETLDTNYKALRVSLLAAGHINNAQ